ncbi:uncharacterized protein KY384_006563 [Bacidia gigantensis]|uniref:uncharacterized protein n=1 Tax=Bacidia gigantensis TaxID=2732470 RepID=UPI001D03CF42|nr:uncharacterized protein KY384_006563 [Bacidia gigantensis]KAG8528874.1 hypothetical protein KY384_006563 [Bacidia gigantensis]
MSYTLKSTLEYLPEKIQSFQYPDTTLPTPTPNSENRTKWRARHQWKFVVVVGLLVIFGVKTFADGRHSYPVARREQVQSIVEENPILNGTLGFQNVYVLSLPDRSDRREPLLAGANATNLTITVIDAIRDRQIPKSDYPIDWSTNGWVAKEGELGCLMSHLRFWRKVIYENITTALVMESDVDWDMRIKQTMVGIGRGARAIADWPFDPEPEEQPSEISSRSKNTSMPQPRPYGDKWDLLWIGHCGSQPQNGGRLFHFNDSSAADEDHAWTFGVKPDAGLRPYGTRLVYHAKQQVCTTSYAVTNKGARKLERMFRYANGPIDIKLWDACENDPRFTCVGVWPQVISMTESRTNIAHTEGGLSFGHVIKDEKIHAGQGIQVSARVNAYLQKAHLGEKGWKYAWKNRNRTTERIERMKEIEEEFYLQEAPFYEERPLHEEKKSSEEAEDDPDEGGEERIERERIEAQFEER